MTIHLTLQELAMLITIVSTLGTVAWKLLSARLAADRKAIEAQQAADRTLIADQLAADRRAFADQQAADRRAIAAELAVDRAAAAAQQAALHAEHIAHERICEERYKRIADSHEQLAEVSDERHTENSKRLDKMDVKLDRLLEK